MAKKLTALAALVLLLLTQRPHAQGGSPQARIYFVDVGQGAGTLIVGPPATDGTVKTLLVDGGPPGGGTTKIIPLLDTLGIGQIDFTVVTHYHIDHIAGITELLNAGRVAGIAYDNGDGADVAPPNPGGTRNAYLNYVAAAGTLRQTIQPGQVIDLGGGMRATCVAAGGRLLSGGAAAITNEDLNSSSISVLVEYNNFDYLVSGDLTGGGSTSTAKTPDVETYVGQQVGDVDVVQLNHHGSTTTSNQTFLSTVKAEVGVAQSGENNTFGHPNREVVNKYLNTPTTGGSSFGGTGVPPPGTVPIFYQNEESPAGDDRVTRQGLSAAAAGGSGQGTLLIATDGTTTFAVSSFDDGGTRINPALNVYPVDGASPGVTTDFGPTVIPQADPVLPLATESVTVSAAVNDESPIASVSLGYVLNGAAQSPIAMTPSGGVYLATIPAQPDGTLVEFTIAASAGARTTTFSSGYFSGTTLISPVRALNPKGEPRFAGYAARVQGIVTASAFSGSTTNDDYVQDASGAINVYRATDTPTPFVPATPGQTVEARGRIGFNGGRLRLDIMESIEKATSPFGVAVLATNPAPAPAPATIAEISTNPESFEGRLVSIANVSIVSGSIPATPQPFDTFVTISDGTGDLPLKIDDDTDIEGFTPAAPFTAIGIIQQDDFLRPFDAGYNITPRSRVDLGAPPPPETPLLTIAEARVDQVNNATSAAGADFVPDRLGQAVKIRGVVTSIDFRAGTANGIEYYVQDATGGIDLFSTTLNPGPFEIGEMVEAIGAVAQFNGLTELNISNVGSRGQGTAPAAEVVTLSQLGNSGAGEAFEGRLVRIDNVTMAPGSFGAPGTSNNFTINDGTATGTLRVDSDTDIDGTPTPTGSFSLIGLVGQFDTSAPFNSGYQVIPRSVADLVPGTCAPIVISGTLPGGTVGTPYSASLTASGGTAPYSFGISSGSVPAGLGLSIAGVLSGIPSAGGTFTFAVTATAADACVGTATYTVGVVDTAPVLTASPPSIALGAVAIGESASAPVTLSNIGGGILTLGTLEITGPDATQFQAGAPGSTTLAAGASTTAAVTFLPTTAGAKSATLTITSNGGTTTVALTGTGSGTGGIVISEFRTRGPATGVGSGNDEFVEIYNNSGAPIDIGGYRLFGSNNAGGGTATPRATVPAGVVLPARAHYLFVNTTATTGYSLPVPGNRGFATGITDDGGIAIFDATGATPLDAVGMSNGSAFKEPAVLSPMAGAANQSYQRLPGGLAVTLQDTGNNAADFELLDGVAKLPNPQNLVLTAAPARIDFGSVMPPATVAQTVTVKNVLLMAVTLNAPALSGVDASSFSLGTPSTTTLAGGAAATIVATFQPDSAGVKNASLSITSSNGGALEIPLSGTGLPGILVSPPSIDFGSVAPGSTALANVAITNGNPTEVTLTPPFVITGADGAEFSVAAPGTTTLPASSETTAAVTFQPGSLGPKNASLQITSVNGGSRTVALSGLAVCPAITVSGVLPMGEFGAAYSQTLTAGGSAGPFTFSIASGALPAGLTLDPAGTVAGTPTALGTFGITVEATAANGCTGTADFAVTIRDTTPPALTVPATITTEATGPTTPVAFSVTASDVADPAPAIACVPASGFAFPVAATTVSCTATDASGNSAPGNFIVTVTDHTAPALTLPGTLTATATSPSGAVVTYPASASDLVDGARTVACAPASGSTFAIGTTLVSCSTSDLHGNAATGSFNVIVAAAAQPGRMIGDGRIEAGAISHTFAFFVQERTSGADVSAIRYTVKTRRPGRDLEDRFDAIAVTGVTFFNIPGVSPGPQPPSGVDTVTFRGTGRWNGRSGYTFDAGATDAGEPGRGRDIFAMTVRDAAGRIVASVDAPITSGNVQSLRITR